MGSLDLTYALPVSCIRVDGTITETTDDVLGTTERVPEATVALHVHGLLRNQTVRVKTGPLRDTNVSLQLTDDGRLKSADSESTGQFGKVVLGVVGAGATITGLFVGPVATAATAAAATAGARAGREAFTGDIPQPVGREKTPDELVAAAYAKAHAQLADLRARYLQLIDQTVEQIARLAEQLVNATDSGARRTLLGELRRSEQLLPLLRAELELLNAHFKAWRVSTIRSRVEHHQRCFSLDALRHARVRVEHGDLHFDASDPHPSIVFAWNHLGVAVTISPTGKVAATETAEPQARSNEILVRLPRRVQLSVWERVGEKAVLTEQRPHLVVDAASDTEVCKLRRSLWARRSVKLGFSDLGVVSSYSYGAASSAAAAADALGGMPAGIAAGLEQASKIRTQLATLQTSAVDAELTSAKKRVELKQQEITAAGLAATQADSAELALLKQQAEMAEKRKTLREAAPPAEPTGVTENIAQLKQQMELLTARHDVAVMTRELEAEAELGAMRLELERMRLEAEKRAASDGQR